MKRFIAIFILIIFINPYCAMSQAGGWVSANKEELVKNFEAVNNWFLKTKSYQLNVTHQSYENYETQTVYDQSNGYFIKSENNYHSFLMGIHTIQNKQLKMVIDSTNKLIAIANPDSWTDNPFSFQDFQYAVESCENVFMQKKNSEIKYKMILDEEAPVTTFEFTIQNEKLTEIMIYMNKMVPSDSDAFEMMQIKPRVSIKFSNYKTEEQLIKETDFAETKYIYSDDENKFFLQEKYKNYQLIDSRIN